MAILIDIKCFSFICVIIWTVLASRAHAYPYYDEFEVQGKSDQEEGRFFFPIILSTANGMNLNVTTIAAISAIMASGFLTMLGLTALAFMLFSMMPANDYYYGTGGSGGYGGQGAHSSTYSSYRR